jgi:hypothetical protein
VGGGIILSPTVSSTKFIRGRGPAFKKSVNEIPMHNERNALKCPLGVGDKVGDAKIRE